MAEATGSVVTVAAADFPQRSAKIGIVEAIIDLPTINAELTGNIVTGTTIQCLSLPAGTIVLAAGIQIMETLVGATAFPVSLGTTGVDSNAFVPEIDIGAGTSYVATDFVETGSLAGATGVLIMGGGAAGAASNTIDITVGTATDAASTAGILRVFAVVATS